MISGRCAATRTRWKSRKCSARTTKRGAWPRRATSSEDLYASIRVATRAHGIDFIPGAAELGDFDPTSTTIALAPGGEQGRLPADLLHNTFERYWREFRQRETGQREWKDYTPYE